MFLITRPSRQAIESLLAASVDLPLSYGPVGLATTGAAGYDADETLVTIGRGSADFERAQRALAGWAQFGLGWVELYPERASTEPGTAVAVLIRHFGFWSLNGCRVVYQVGDDSRGPRFGFAYGTLPTHVEAGEELFEVRLETSGAVTYRISAVSRPRAVAARAGYPIARWLQARFRRESALVMERAVRADS